MNLLKKLSNEFSVYAFFVVGWSALGIHLCPMSGDYVGFSIWFMVYIAVNFWLGNCAKNWLQIAFWFISVPDFAMLIFIGDSDSANSLGGKGQLFY